ncbi:MAG: hypothetical protein AAFX59_12815 [Pseudomonadota bacterium]
MSTWICKPLALAAVLTLAGCDGGFDMALGAAGQDMARSAPERVAVTGDAVVVSGPPGFCVDGSVTRDTGQSAFVLLGSCASISRDPAQPRPAVPGILTVSIGPPASAAVAEQVTSLDAYVRSDAGRAAISRRGDAEDLVILETLAVDGALYIHARDTGSAGGAQIGDDYWRALMGVGGHLVTASVVSFPDQPMSRDVGFELLDSLAARLRGVNT